MNTRKDERVELIALIESVLGKTAGAAQVRRLDELLADDEAARSIYLDYVDLHACLSRRYASGDYGSAGDEPRDALVEVARSESVGGSSWRTLAAFALAVSAAIAIVGLPLMQRRLGVENADVAQAEDAFAADEQASLSGVAVLSGAIDVDWADGDTAHKRGAAIPASTLEIESGVVQLDFYSGAIVVLEGPAKIDLLTASSARLHAGKLRTRVPARARGFEIHTTSGKVIDLGTEFAMDLREGGGELHVIDGEVRFEPPGSDSGTGTQLTEGQALSFDVSGKVRSDLQVSLERFVGPSEIERIARDRRSERYERWRDWRREFVAEPEVIAYLAHSPEPKRARTLRNFAEHGLPESHGVVVGCEWGAGRWPGHKAVRFRNASHRVSVNFPGAVDSLSLAAWINVDRFHPTNVVALMHPETRQLRHLHWTLDRVPTGAVLHFADSAAETPDAHWEGSRAHYSSKGQGMFNKDVGKWAHVAVVYDYQLRRVTHYRDGKVVGWQPIESPRPLEIGIADIGNWPYKDWATGTEFESRHLMGRIDEFVVVGRALTGNEIAEMHAVGAP